MTEPRRWVMDTSAFTHLCRAGHAEIIEKLSPGGVVLIPDVVNTEIENGRERYQGIPTVSSISWAEIAVLSDEETLTQLVVKAQLGGLPHEHLGECAVIACAHHRNLVAILDERAAVEQAELLGVQNHGTLWLVIEAYKKLYGRDRDRTAKVVNGLLATDMYLPVDSGESLLSWAFEEGLLP
jgi:predicted nucleic acid-binding protein